MNLLPPKIMRRRQIYSECKKLAAIQAVIFLLFILSVASIDRVIVLREGHIAEMNMKLEDERFAESEAIAQAIRNHYAREAAQQAAAAWLELPVFNTERLNMMRETLPHGVSLLNIDINEHGALLTSETMNLSLSDIHRDAWLATGLVSRVQLASAVVTEEKRVRYILALHWAYEE